MKKELLKVLQSNTIKGITSNQMALKYNQFDAKVTNLIYEVNKQIEYEIQQAQIKQQQDQKLAETNNVMTPPNSRKPGLPGLNIMQHK